ncbi:prepilin-type N-terminal cleavage/methylation domain-containing protein [Candidatus Saccharibacteria bacterium]|nr:prepilin-type N-terminal cleavage/methylation domain-containing protein [Candidatus Saccharibacteria bacterium]
MARLARGFTIVELLIVIVVIGILALIAINSISTAQRRARNAQMITTVKDYRKALIGYAIDNGSYPIGTGTACLGESYSFSWCGWGVAEDANFNNAIRPYMTGGTLPKPGDNPLNYNGCCRKGAFIDNFAGYTVNGISVPWGINYIIEGFESCGLGDVMIPAVGDNWPNFSSTPDPARGGVSERSGDGNMFCRIRLPDPTTL